MFLKPVAVRVTALILMIGLAACSGEVEVSPPPPESRYVSPLPAPLESFVLLSQPDAERHIVSGIGSPAGERGRWAERRIVMRFLTPAYVELKFRMRFVLPQELIDQSGPLTLKVFAAGQRISRTTYKQAGEHAIEESVPRELLRWDANTEVVIETETSARPTKPDGLRFILASAGFQP